MTDLARASDLHIHTELCDGADSPEAMVERACELGLGTLGFSGHSPTDFGCEWALSDVDGYVARINSLKGKYGGTEILCGLEYDSCMTPSGLDRFDYIIGSVHYLSLPGGRHIPIDESREITDRAIAEDFGGSSDRFAEAYFEAVAAMIDRVRPDIVGHIDLIEKFNVGGRQFDDNTRAYRLAALTALDRAVDRGAVIELNLGAIIRAARGRADIRPLAYPSELLLLRLRERGGAPILSSDAHRAEDIAGGFDEALCYLASLGFREITVRDGKNFKREPLDF